MVASAYRQRLAADALRSFDSSSLSISYQAVGTPLAQQTRILNMFNNSTQDITVSYDGVNDHEFVAKGKGVMIEASTNREISDVLEIPQQTQIYVKGAATGTGLFYVSAYYAR